MSKESGCNPYGSAHGVSLQRTCYPLHSIQDNEDMERGRRMEPAILDVICDLEGLEYIASPLITIDVNPRIGATADGLGYREKDNELFILEAKCPRYIPSHPPIQYVIQVQHQLFCWRNELDLLIPPSHRPALDYGFLVCIEEDLVRRVVWKIEWAPEFYDWVTQRAVRTAQYIQHDRLVSSLVCENLAFECTNEMKRRGRWPSPIPEVPMTRVWFRDEEEIAV